MILINKKEHAWVKNTTLVSLLTEFRDEYMDEEDQDFNPDWVTVAINHKFIPTKKYDSVLICDGDEITIFPPTPIAGG